MKCDARQQFLHDKPEDNADALLPLLPLEQDGVAAKQLQLVHLEIKG